MTGVLLCVYGLPCNIEQEIRMQGICVINGVDSVTPRAHAHQGGGDVLRDLNFWLKQKAQHPEQSRCSQHLSAQDISCSPLGLEWSSISLTSDSVRMIMRTRCTLRLAPNVMSLSSSDACRDSPCQCIPGRHGSKAAGYRSHSQC